MDTYLSPSEDTLMFRKILLTIGSLFVFKFTIISYTTETIEIKHTARDLSGIEHACVWLPEGTDFALVHFTKDRGVCLPSNPWWCNTFF